MLAIRGQIDGDVDRLIDDLPKILKQHHLLLGTPADLDRYVFLIEFARFRIWRPRAPVVFRERVFA